MLYAFIEPTAIVAIRPSGTLQQKNPNTTALTISEITVSELLVKL